MVSRPPRHRSPKVQVMVSSNTYWHSCRCLSALTLLLVVQTSASVRFSSQGEAEQYDSSLVGTGATYLGPSTACHPACRCDEGVQYASCSLASRSTHWADVAGFLSRLPAWKKRIELLEQQVVCGCELYHQIQHLPSDVTVNAYCDYPRQLFGSSVTHAVNQLQDQCHNTAGHVVKRSVYSGANGTELVPGPSVLPRLTVTVKPAISSVLHGARVELTCTVSEEASRLIWERKDRHVIPVGGRFSSTLARFVTVHKLTISRVTMSDEGVYMCVALVGLRGQVESASASIRVLPYGLRLSGNANATIYEGRVELRPGYGVWGTMCSLIQETNYLLRSADVVCRELGYGLALRTTHDPNTYGIWEGSMYLLPECDGNEQVLDDCNHEGLLSPAIGCTANQTFGVVCEGPLPLNATETPATCTFNDGLCGWRNLRGDHTNWVRTPLSVAVNTTANESAADELYLMAERQQGLAGTQHAFLESPLMTAQASTCQMTFDYLMAGDNVGGIKIIMRTRSTQQLLWSRFGGQASTWLSSGIEVNSTEDFEITVEAEFFLDSKDVLGFDNVVFQACDGSINASEALLQCDPQAYQCNNTYCLSKAFVCNGYDDCGDNSDELDCDIPIRLSGVNGSNLSGVVEVQYGGKWGTMCYNGRLPSPVGDVLCNQLGLGFSGEWFTPPHSQKPAWESELAVVEGIPNCSEDAMSFGDCKHRGWHWLNCTTGAAYMSCSGEKNYDAGNVFGSCDFEQTKCDWNVSDRMLFARYQWKMTSSLTKVLGSSRPKYDHTYQGFQGGSYMLFDPTSMYLGRRYAAYLRTPLLPADPEHCHLRFFYYMSGKRAGELRIRRRYEGERGRLAWSTLFWRKGPASPPDQWHQGDATVNSERPFFLMIVGRPRSSNPTSDEIAIDDFSFMPCSEETDVDECKLIKPCGDNALCNNTQTAYECYCPDGYYMDDETCYNSTSVGLGDCGFEREYCEWVRVGSYRYQWRLNNGSTPSWFTGPSSGNHFINSTGWYTYFETSSLPKNAQAGLQSPLLPGNNSNYCQMEFFYHMYGEHVGSLSVRIDAGPGFKEYWHEEFNRGNTWFPAKVRIDSSVPFRVRIIARGGEGWRSDIALDDVTFGKCGPEVSGDCDMEYSTCAWKALNVSDGVQWNHTRALPAGGNFSSPTEDHTRKSPLGYFFMAAKAKPAEPVKGGSQAAKNSVSGFRSDILPIDAIHCQLSFYYHMHSETDELWCEISDDDGASWTELWRVDGYFNGKWLYGAVNVNMTSPFRVQFWASVSIGGHVAIDDIGFRECSTVFSGLDLLMFSNETLAELFSPGVRVVRGPDWIWGTIDGYSPGTVISKLDQNNRVRVEWDNGYVKGFYRIRGESDRYDLDILGVPSEQNCSVRDSLGRWWEMCDVGAVCSFESAHGFCNCKDGFYGDGHLCIDGNATDLGTCIFADDMCQWEHSMDSVNHFEIHKGKTASEGTGPRSSSWYSSTVVDQNYIYFEASNHDPGTTAGIVSPWLPPSEKYCEIDFHYHMYGKGIGSLHIYKVTENRSSHGEYLEEELWKQSQDRGRSWHNARVTINATSVFKIKIVAVRGATWQSDIALDSIFFFPCTEVRNGFCEFEDDKCGWETASDNSSVLSFQRSKQISFAVDSIDTKVNDHTRGNSYGSFMLLYSTEALSVTSATLRSPMLQGDTFHCQVGFYYRVYLEGDGGSLALFMIANGSKSEQKIWSHSATTPVKAANGWLYKAVNLDYHDQFRLEFHGTVSSGRTLLGIDDITFRACGKVATDLDYSMFTQDQIRKLFSKGTSVVRGSSWNWRTEDGYQKGKVLMELDMRIGSHTYIGWVQTQWASGYVSMCRMGVGGFYDLERYEEFDPCRFQYSNDTTNPCADNAVCRSAVNHNFTCTCNTSFVGNGFSCVEALQYGKTPVTGIFGHCTFENGTCGWFDSPDTPYSWTLNYGTTATSGTGPSFDMTLKNASGHYLYFETSFVPLQARAIFQSPLLPGNVTDYCQLVFHYHKYGMDIGSLSVEIETENGSRTTVWKSVNDRSDRWFKHQIDINSSVPYSVRFIATRGSGFRGDVSLDDVSFGECTHVQGPCMFEDGVCDWTSTGDGVEWTRDMGVDHTRGNQYGHYMHAKLMAADGNTTDSSFLTSPELPPDENHCQLLFSYSLTTGVTLEVYGNFSSDLRLLGEFEAQAVDSKSFYTGLSINETDGPFTVLFRAVVRGAVPADQEKVHAKIDDINFRECLDLPDYSMNYCKAFTYEQLKQLFPVGTRVIRGLDWEWSFQDNFSPGQVTSAIGSLSRGPGWLNVRWDSGMTGNYRMGHGGKCDLELLRKVDGCTELAEITGQVGSCSPYAQCTAMSNNTAMYSCKCETGYRGDGYDCMPEVDAAGEVGPGYGDCRFDDGWCRWRPSPLRRAAWYRHSGATPSDKTGPNHGSSYSNVTGKYIYFEASGLEEQEKAGVISPLLKGGDSYFCQVEFVYHMSGQDVGSLLLKVIPYGGEEADTKIVWSKLFDRGDTWFPAFVKLDQKSDFRIEFVASRGRTYRSDVAIDDIRFLPCAPVARGNCDFESGMCGWVDRGEGADKYGQWSVEMGILASRSGEPEPHVDHTRKSSQGFFVRAKALPDNHEIKNTRLMSPLMNRTQHNCRMDFYYYFSPNPTSTVELHVSASSTEVFGTGEDIVHFSVRNDDLSTGSWRHGSIRMKSFAIGELFAVSLNARFTGNDTESTVALDDISFRECDTGPYDIDYTKQSQGELGCLFSKGSRVMRGRDWRWTVQDGYGPGTVVAGPSNETDNVWVSVVWDNGYENSYRVGYKGRFDLAVIDMDRCAQCQPCAKTTTCISDGPKHTCMCAEGYFGNSTVCYAKPEKAGCNFDTDLCGWKKGSEATLDWNFYKGLVGNQNLARRRRQVSSLIGQLPTVGASGTGGYLYSVASESSKPEDNLAVLESVPLNPQTVMCQVKYSLIMFGSEEASFELRAVKASGESTVLRAVTVAVGSNWVAMVTELPQDGLFSLEFRATPGVNGAGIVAIDDIILGACQAEPCDSTPLPNRGSFEVRLSGGDPDGTEGRLEVRTGQNAWGGVCDDQFDDFAGDIVCHQLGFGDVYRVTRGAVTRGKFSYGGRSMFLFWLSHVHCDLERVGKIIKGGDVTSPSLSDCNACPWGYAADHCKGDESVGLVCNVDGGVGDWGEWSMCIASCDSDSLNGNSTRRRLCDSPLPKHDGKKCEDTEVESKECRAEKCTNVSPPVTEAEKPSPSGSDSKLLIILVVVIVVAVVVLLVLVVLVIRWKRSTGQKAPAPVVQMTGVSASNPAAEAAEAAEADMTFQGQFSVENPVYEDEDELDTRQVAESPAMGSIIPELPFEPDKLPLEDNEVKPAQDAIQETSFVNENPSASETPGSDALTADQEISLE